MDTASLAGFFLGGEDFFLGEPEVGRDDDDDVLPDDGEPDAGRADERDDVAGPPDLDGGILHNVKYVFARSCETIKVVPN